MAITCATVQTYPQFADPESNLAKTLQLIGKYSQKNAELIVFPECNLSGYCFESMEEATKIAEKIPGPITDAIALKAKETNTFIHAGKGPFEVIDTKIGQIGLLICDPNGMVLAEACSNSTDVNLVKIEPKSSQENTVVIQPGEFEFDVMKDRRPDLYGIIAEDS